MDRFGNRLFGEPNSLPRVDRKVRYEGEGTTRKRQQHLKQGLPLDLLDGSTLQQASETELVELERSIGRLRTQRSYIARLGEEIIAKDDRIAELERVADQLRDRVRLVERNNEDVDTLVVRAKKAEESARMTADELAKKNMEVARMFEMHQAFEASMRSSIAQMEHERNVERISLSARVEAAEKEAGVAKLALEQHHEERVTLQRALEEANRRLDDNRLDASGKLKTTESRVAALREELARVAFERGQIEEKVVGLSALVERQRLIIEEKVARTEELEKEKLVWETMKNESLHTNALLRRQLAHFESSLESESKTLREDLLKERDAKGRIEALSNMRLKESEKKGAIILGLKGELASARKSAEEHAKRAKKMEERHEEAIKLVDELRAELLNVDEKLRSALREKDMMEKQMQAATKAAEGERSERAQWAKARMELLNEFNSEEKRLDEVMRANDVLLSSYTANLRASSASRGFGSPGAVSPPLGLGASATRRSPRRQVLQHHHLAPSPADSILAEARMRYEVGLTSSPFPGGSYKGSSPTWRQATPEGRDKRGAAPATGDDGGKDSSSD